MPTTQSKDPSRFELMGAIANKVLARERRKRERRAKSMGVVEHPYLTPSDQRRFWAKVRRGRRCWVWEASLMKRGSYGQFMLRGRVLRAHRVAYELLVGSAEGLLVCHTCDNPPCCNPKHLFLGTIADNNADAMAKGRTFVPDSPRGSEHHSSKLTVAQVRVIRKLRGKVTGVELARRFGVTKSAVSRIQLGKVWKSAYNTK